MFSISKRFDFSASHQLDYLPDGHKCARLHGHNYAVVIELEAHKLNSNGFVMDYADLDFVKEYIDEQLDHRHLNDVFGCGSLTTAENLAQHFAHFVLGVIPRGINVKAGVSETQKTWASYMTSYTNYELSQMGKAIRKASPIPEIATTTLPSRARANPSLYGQTHRPKG